MWTPQTPTRYICEAEPGVPDEKAFPASLVTPAISYAYVKVAKCQVQKNVHWL